MLPELVAHRGYALHYPENTLAALRAAAAAGARHVEVDVQLARDRVPVLFHDRTLERLCAVPGAIHERGAAELARLAASEPGRFGERFAREPIATLEAFAGFLAEQPQVGAFVEIKRIALEHFGPGVVLERTLAALGDVIDRVALISFSIDVLHAARALGRTPVGPVIERWSDLADPRVAGLAAEYVFADVQILPPAGALRREGSRLVVYEIDDPGAALALAARGADMIETFAVGEMIAALAPLSGGA